MSGPPDSASLRNRWRQRLPMFGPGPWFKATALAVIIFGAGLFGINTWQDYQETVDRGWLTADRAARVLEEEASRALDASRLVTGRLADALQVHGFDWLRGPGWTQMQKYVEASPAIGSLWVLDADARLVATSMRRDPPDARFPDREDLPVLRAGEASEYIRALQLGEVSGIWFFSYSRPLVLDGDFAGVVQASMHAAYFEQLYQDLGLPPGSAIALYRDDGALVMRWPLPAGEAAARPGAADMPTAAQSRPSGRLEREDADGAAHLLAWQRSPDRPVVAVSSVPRDAALAPFWRRFARDGAVFALAVLLMLLLARAGLLASRREEEQRRALRESERRLARERQFLHAVIENAPAGIAIVDDAEGKSVLNEAGRRMTGVSDFEVDLEERYRRLNAVHPDGRPYEVDDYPTARSLRRGEEVEGEEMIYEGAGERRRWLVSSRPLRDEKTGKPTAAVTVFWDVEDLRRAEERQRMLMAELDHRVKNALAVVQSIAKESLHDAGDAADRFIGRLSALAETHSLLADSRWEGASLHKLAVATAAPYGDGAEAGRVRVSGPELILTPKAAQALALVLHELATNAARHGALSADSGRVNMDWHVSGDGNEPRVTLVWKETGGPRIDTPEPRKGFGSRLIEMTLPYELDGTAELDFRPAGLVATIEFPLTDVVGAADGHGAPGNEGAPATGERGLECLAGRRILVAEDQFIIAHGICEALRDAGAVVVGPAADLESARRLAEGEAVDVAILDLDLKGEMVWPVARILQARQVPCLFTSGYADDLERPAGFGDARYVEKPIEPERLLSDLSLLFRERAAD